jgi:ABC-2 type transport system ATP-binding protein
LSGEEPAVPPVIRVEQLVKEFRRAKKQDGFLGGVRTLFTRQYETVRAVDGVSFSIDPGELVGYIGPNGAGKSTTIKMMTGILVPTKGVLDVGGLVPWRDRERNALQIGVVFGQRSQLWWDLPLIESFQLIGKLYRVPAATYQRNLARFIDLLAMEEFLDRPVRQLSLGQRMRGDLAASMLYEPRILYLDEPTIGLDIVAKESMRTFIEEMNRDSGTTIVLTTHDLADVERLCRRIILIDHGHVLYDGSVEQLKAKYAPYRTLVVELAPDDVGGGATPTIDRAQIPGAELVEQADRTVRISFEAATTRVQDLIAAVNARYPVADLSIVEPDLESVVRQIYGERVPIT